MARRGRKRTFTRAHDWSADRDAGGSSAIIDADKMDEEFDNYKAGLEQCLTRDGQTNPSADLPMAGRKHTGVANAAARDQYAAVAQVQDQAFTHVNTVGGTVDAITLTPAPAITAYAAGQQFTFVAAGANTGAVTVDVSGVGAKAVTKNGATALEAGDITSGAVVRLHYDGTQFQVLSPNGNLVAGPASSVDARIATFSGTSGKVLQDGGASIADLGDVDGPSSAVDSRLAAFDGTTGKLLKDSGKLASDLQDDVVTTRGDLVRGGSAGAAERLALGTSGQVLTSDGTDAAWADPSGGGDFFVGGNVLAPHERLVCKYVSATTVDIDANAVLLRDSSNSPLRAANVNLTLDITASGANGLDTGSEANSTWYHLWVISNGSTTAGLLSTSETAPTMPSGYTHKGYVGAVYNDSGGDFNEFHQVGDKVVIPLADAVSGGTATSYTSVSIAAIIPATASSVCGIMFAFQSGGNCQTFIAANAQGWGERIVRSPNFTNNVGIGGGFDLTLIESQNIYYKVETGDNGNARISGWKY